MSRHRFSRLEWGILEKLEQIINPLYKYGDWQDLKHQLETIINQPDLITALKQNIQPPVSMNMVAKLVEKEYLKVLKDKW